MAGSGGNGKMLLQFTDVHTHYGPLHVLKGVSYEIREGEIVSLLGGNASGKSTTMKTILGLVRPTEGTVTFRGEPIHTLRTAEIVRRGIAPVPEARRVFPRMTVLENLEMGRYTRRGQPGWEAELERVYRLFPVLKERRAQLAGTLSGGEQQMLAIGRALMAKPDPPLHGRALDGAFTGVRRAGLRHHPDDQRAGHDDLRRRAERQHGAVDRPPGLRPADG